MNVGGNVTAAKGKGLRRVLRPPDSGVLSKREYEKRGDHDHPKNAANASAPECDRP